MKQPIQRRWKITLLVGGIAVFAYTANYFITPSVIGVNLELHFRPHENAKFDSQTWKRASPVSIEANELYGRRYEMVDDLLTSQLPIGTVEERVVVLLGPPEMTEVSQGTKRLFYVLADQRSYPARSFWFPRLFANLDRWMLEIRIRDGRVILSRLYFD
jgi:hypothetical protein